MTRIAVPAMGWVLLTGLMLVACSGVPELDDDDVPVLRERPACDYESLGVIKASDGHEGHPGGQVWGPQGSDRIALARLRAEAVARGGDAVLLVNRLVSERPAGAGSIQKRPGRVITYTGVAIKDCR